MPNRAENVSWYPCTKKIFFPIIIHSIDRICCEILPPTQKSRFSLLKSITFLFQKTNPIRINRLNYKYLIDLKINLLESNWLYCYREIQLSRIVNKLDKECRGLKLKVSRGPHETESKVWQAALKNEEILFELLFSVFAN